KDMKRTLHWTILVGWIISLAACTGASTDASSAIKPESAPAAASAAPTATAPTPPPDEVKPEAKPAPKVTVPAGTKLRVALLDAVSSDKSQDGDTFLASLNEPVVTNGKTVFAKGTKVRGRVVEAVESGRVKGRASLQLKLTEIVRDKGKNISISTKKNSEVAPTTKKSDAGNIGGGRGPGGAT